MDNQNKRVGCELLAWFLMDGEWKRRSAHHHALVVRCTFSIWALTLNVVPWAKAMMNFPSQQLPLFQRSTQYERGGLSVDRSPMSNEKQPNGSSTALHQGRWSWRGGCSEQLLKTASQATHLCSWVPSMAWSIQTLQHIETCEWGTKREIQGENREWQTGKKRKTVGLWCSWLQTQKPKLSVPLSFVHVELKPKASLCWAKAPKECNANLHSNSPSYSSLSPAVSLMRFFSVFISFSSATKMIHFLAGRLFHFMVLLSL